MNNLEKLVPPLELCKQIPVGRFEESALVWNTTVCDEDTGEIVGVHERDDCEGWMRENQIPAPTAEELLVELGSAVSLEFFQGCFYPHHPKRTATDFASPSAADALLDIYLSFFPITRGDRN